MPVLEQYRIFAAVAKKGSFSEAAAELFITQPAVSRSVKLLEEELGAQLFIRNARGSALTDTGKALYSYVSEALGLFEGAQNYINDLKKMEVGTLNIGASDTLCRHFLLPHLKTFHKKFSGVNLKVTNRTSKETVELLKKGAVDIGFINMPTELEESIESRELARLHDTFVYSEKRMGKIGEKDILGICALPLLMLERESSTRRYVESFFSAEGASISPQIELGSHDLLLSFADIGLGVACVVREYSQDYIASGRLTEIKLEKNITERGIALIFKKNIPLTFAAKEFIKLIEEK